jgi:hypothetical protein
MSVENESSIQKVDSDDSIIACQQYAVDFFDSIDPSRTPTVHGSIEMGSVLDFAALRPG